MTNSLSPFILKRSIASPSIHYEWDDWNTEAVEEPPNVEVLEALNAVSFRALLAFTSSTAEWILARYSGLVDTTLPEHFVAASWIAQIDRRYLAREWEDHPDADEDLWRGPIKGPIGTAMVELMYAGQQAESAENPEIQACWMTNLAVHIQVDSKLYVEWRRWLLGKFQLDHPRSLDDPKGAVVPRESCDPDVPFQKDLAGRMINVSLAQARAGINPFLKSAEALIRSGFEGQPYSFDGATE